MKANPKTFISCFLGYMNKIKTYRLSILVMLSIFPSLKKNVLTHIYDLKGSIVGRRTNNPSKGVTLKDLDWLDLKRKIGLNDVIFKSLFTQLQSDVKFLNKKQIMDYSLLLAVEEIDGENHADAVLDKISHALHR
eukprot:UN02905